MFLTPLFATHPRSPRWLLNVQACFRRSNAFRPIPFSFKLFCIFLHSFPSAQNSTLFFSSVSALFAKNTGGAGIFHLEARSVPIPYPLSPPMLLYIVTSLLLFFSHEREL